MKKQIAVRQGGKELLDLSLAYTETVIGKAIDRIRDTIPSSLRINALQELKEAFFKVAMPILKTQILDQKHIHFSSDSSSKPLHGERLLISALTRLIFDYVAIKEEGPDCHSDNPNSLTLRHTYGERAVQLSKYDISHALLRALRSASTHGKKKYAASNVYNEFKKEADKIANKQLYVNEQIDRARTKCDGLKVAVSSDLKPFFEKITDLLDALLKRNVALNDIINIIVDVLFQHVPTTNEQKAHILHKITDYFIKFNKPMMHHIIKKVLEPKTGDTPRTERLYNRVFTHLEAASQLSIRQYEAMAFIKNDLTRLKIKCQSTKDMGPVIGVVVKYGSTLLQKNTFTAFAEILVSAILLSLPKNETHLKVNGHTKQLDKNEMIVLFEKALSTMTPQPLNKFAAQFHKQFRAHLNSDLQTSHP